jgi:hypothetical protein
VLRQYLPYRFVQLATRDRLLVNVLQVDDGMREAASSKWALLVLQSWLFAAPPLVRATVQLPGWFSDGMVSSAR